MKILVINCGSSSVKYCVMDMQHEDVLVEGVAERIGLSGAFVAQKKDGKKTEFYMAMASHKEAIRRILELLTDDLHGVLKSLDEINAVGHRIVHGGEHYAESVYVTEDVIDAIDDCRELAPLHNHAHVLGIRACMAAMPDIPMVCVFDTAFHQTMPPDAYLYAIPYEYYKKYKIRKYGFHGTSHGYVSHYAAELLGEKAEDLKIITCHLGNGASLAAVKNGKCYDTSMGLTPLDGLVMGSRCGMLDPTVVQFLAEKEFMTPGEVLNLLNKKSGLLGISGVSSDFRDVEESAESGDERAQMAIRVYVHRIKSFIGAYTAEMNGLDVLVFTAGVGENDAMVRGKICENMDFLGIKVDEEKNKNAKRSDAFTDISAADSRVKVVVLKTNEELVIARDTKRIVENMKQTQNIE